MYSPRNGEAAGRDAAPAPGRRSLAPPFSRTALAIRAERGAEAAAAAAAGKEARARREGRRRGDRLGTARQAHLRRAGRGSETARRSRDWRERLRARAPGSSARLGYARPAPPLTREPPCCALQGAEVAAPAVP